MVQWLLVNCQPTIQLVELCLQSLSNKLLIETWSRLRHRQSVGPADTVSGGLLALTHGPLVVTHVST